MDSFWPLAPESWPLTWFRSSTGYLPAGRQGAAVKKQNKMDYNVYVLRSERDGRFYVGFTNYLKRRLSEHNSGKTKSTKGYRPWKLILVEAYETRNKARSREKYLKSGSGKEYIKELWFRSSTGYLPAGRHGAAQRLLDKPKEDNQSSYWRLILVP